MKKIGINAVFLVAAFINSGSSFAAEIIVPHVFTAGTPAKADEVNANFSALANELGNVSQSNSELRSALGVAQDQLDDQDLSLSDIDIRVQILEETAGESASSLAYDFPDYVWPGETPHRPGDVVPILGGTMTIGQYNFSNVVSSQSSFTGSVQWPIEISIPGVFIGIDGAILSTSMVGFQSGDEVYQDAKQSVVIIDGSKVVYSNVLYSYLTPSATGGSSASWSDSHMFVSVEIDDGIWLNLKWEVDFSDDGFALSDIVAIRDAILDVLRVVK